jgi:hypothetical protein
MMGSQVLSGAKLWGFSREGVDPLPPLEEDLTSKFIWTISDADRLQLPPPPIHTLIPSDPAVAPPGRTYPQASIYVCNDTFDPQYASGWFFHSDYHRSEYAQLRHDLMRIDLPPNIGPTGVAPDGTLIKQPPPAMHRLSAGYPHVKYVDGDPKRRVTEVCLQTNESLQRWPKVYAQIMPALREVATLSFGQKATDKQPGVRAIFEYLTVHNKRSPGDVGTYDGSYNLAGMNSEGQGAGLLMPAIQTNTPEARTHIARVLHLIHKLWRLVMPLCISKLEWDVIEFHANLCNTMSFGGCEPGPTACQLNVSSSAKGGDLAKWIGEQQGSVHVDQKDDPTR